MASYTRLGAKKAVTSEDDKYYDGKVYIKKNLSKQEIDNYRLAETIGVGVPLVSYH